MYPTRLVIKYELIPDLIIQQQNAFQHNLCRQLQNCRLKSTLLGGNQIEKRWNGLNYQKWLSVMHFEKAISQSNHTVNITLFLTSSFGGSAAKGLEEMDIQILFSQAQTQTNNRRALVTLVNNLCWNFKGGSRSSVRLIMVSYWTVHKDWGLKIHLYHDR